jgi:UDPglucose 6-dehydrogenase
MKIGVIGIGTVGNAVLQGLSVHHDVVGYDTKKPEYCKNVDKLGTMDMVFLCLPTPTNAGLQDRSAVQRTLLLLQNMKFEGIVVVKSTIIPGICEKFNKNMKLNIVHCPEFISEKTAIQDFKDQKEIIIGGNKNRDDFKATMEKVLKAHQPLGVRRAYVGSSTQTEMIKYMHNIFLACKVGICNELFSVCEDLKLEYQPLMNIAASITGWINPRHISVPHRGRLGFGGECFPKDLAAFNTHFRHINLDIIQATIDSNKLRAKRFNPKRLIDLPMQNITVRGENDKRRTRRPRPQGQAQDSLQTGTDG